MLNKLYDVLVVGSGTAGIYFAKLMAEQGYSVCVIDKSSEEKLGVRFQVMHIDEQKFDHFNVPKPQLGDDDYLNMFPESISKSALDNYPKVAKYPFLVTRLHLYLKRMKS
jgi:choline dehydrogenase-like flavoprotein